MARDDRPAQEGGLRQLQGQGEPAQVTQCPACGNLLAVPEEGLSEGEHTLHLVYQGWQRNHPPRLSLLPKPRPQRSGRGPDDPAAVAQ